MLAFFFFLSHTRKDEEQTILFSVWRQTRLWEPFDLVSMRVDHNATTSIGLRYTPLNCTEI
jgi:hypothetical protein